MTPKQERFVEEYLVDLNATQAAIRAGYSEKTAHSQGPRLLENVGVAAAIEAAQGKRSERTKVTVDRVVDELAGIGFHHETKFHGMECRLSDKLGALDKLGRHLVMFTDKQEVSGPGGGPVEVTDNRELARRVLAALYLEKGEKT